jgi:ABC-2 type transport system ATP-binding protein
MIYQVASTPHEKKIVTMEDLTSIEFYLHEGDIKPVLQKIDLNVLKGQAFGITGKSLFEIKLLLEIIANIRPYNTGKCVLLERGMMRRKRIILPHIFYIGSPNMAYSNMNVLEFLMFCRMKDPENKIELQEEMLDCLIHVGFERIALSPIFSLPKEYRAAVLLLASAFSQSDLIVFNLPDYSFNEDLVEAIAKTSVLVSQKNKTLLISTQDSELLENACTHLAFLLDGKMLFQGSVRDFRHVYDKEILTMWDKNVADMAKLLKVFLPQYEYVLHKDELVIKDSSIGLEEENPRLLYQKIAGFNLVPEKVKLNKKTVSNACKEILKQYDIH